MTYIHELCCTFSHGVTLLKTIKLKIIKKNNFHLSKYVVSLKERYKSKVKEEKKASKLQNKNIENKQIWIMKSKRIDNFPLET